tara:strand:+ start:232 stop:411 length:180 start_codon:yes stop_codon:yes gene_type:complete
MYTDYDHDKDSWDYLNIVNKIKIEHEKQSENERKQSKLKIKSGMIGVDILQQINKLGER